MNLLAGGTMVISRHCEGAVRRDSVHFDIVAGIRIQALNSVRAIIITQDDHVFTLSCTFSGDPNIVV